MCTYFHHIPIKYMAYMCRLVDICFRYMYINNMWIDVVDCVFLHVCTNVNHMPVQNEEFDLYLQCDSHICLVIYANYVKCSLWSVYSTSVYMFSAGDFICNTYMHIHSHYTPLEDIAFLWNVASVFTSATCMTITCEVNFVVDCVGTYMHYVGSIYAHVKWR